MDFDADRMRPLEGRERTVTALSGDQFVRVWPEAENAERLLESVRGDVGGESFDILVHEDFARVEPLSDFDLREKGKCRLRRVSVDGEEGRERRVFGFGRLGLGFFFVGDVGLRQLAAAFLISAMRSSGDFKEPVKAFTKWVRSVTR